MVKVGELTVLVLVVCLGMTNAASTRDEYRFEKEPAHWHNIAGEELRTTLAEMIPRGVAKNVILFLGDGMGATSVTAGRILAGQLQGKKGEEVKLSFDHFPFTGLSRTYNVDTQVTDSAASGTAYLTGVKTNQGTLGLSGRGVRGQCSSAQEPNHVQSILRWSLEAGKSAGLVTTTRVTHATPGASYAHIPERNWESDRLIPVTERDCEDIALQLVARNKDIHVIMGGGRAYFLPEGVPDPEPDPQFNMAEVSRLDGKNLIEMWKEDKRTKNLSHNFVYNKMAFDQVDPLKTDYLLGLFNQDHMMYEAERDKAKEPSLAEMTEKAIRILRKNDKGFFLLVEGGRIDHGHHANEGSKALHEVVALGEAVDVATQLTGKDDTLLVVTADHSHVLGIAGYSARGNPILGKSTTSMWSGDGMPYTTIVYGNGPGYTGVRENLTDVDTEDVNYKQQSAVPMDYETHGGEDVSIYAMGPQSFLYTGVHEQNYIPIAMAYASCVGPYAEDKQNCARYQQRQNIVNLVLPQPVPTDSDSRNSSPKPQATPSSVLWTSAVISALLLCQRTTLR